MKRIRGRLVVIEGGDGVGKSVLAEHAAKLLAGSRRVFDTRRFEQRTNRYPAPDAWRGASVIISAEMTFAHVGRLLREHLVRHGSNVPAQFVVEAFAIDRELHYRQVILPALQRGVDVVQERSVLSSLVYNPLQSRQVTRRQSQLLPGNALALANPADLVVVASVDPRLARARLRLRQKRDQSYYETLAFQRRVNREYHSAWFRQFVRRWGSRLAYLDTGTTIKEAQDALGQVLQAAGLIR